MRSMPGRSHYPCSFHKTVTCSRRVNSYMAWRQLSQLPLFSYPYTSLTLTLARPNQAIALLRESAEGKTTTRLRASGRIVAENSSGRASGREGKLLNNRRPEAPSCAWLRSGKTLFIIGVHDERQGSGFRGRQVCGLTAERIGGQGGACRLTTVGMFGMGNEIGMCLV